MEKMRMESVDMTEKNIEKIESLFPNCITETLDENGKLKKAINFERLKHMLLNEIVDGDEVYEFKWVGKKASIVEANKSIRKTLRPCKEKSVNWDKTENLYIEGDNLEVLKLLQESYLGQVDVIYIDPPYNTGNDFIYNDDYKLSSEEYIQVSNEVDEEGKRLFKNTDSNGRFHSDWCSMIYSRLLLSRNLLSESGVIFISIDDNEQPSLNLICNEIFGRDNVETIVWAKESESNSGKMKNTKTFRDVHEYIIVCYKNKRLVQFSKINEALDNGKFQTTNLAKNNANKNGALDRIFEIVNPENGKSWSDEWKYDKETIDNLLRDNLLWFGKDGCNKPRQILPTDERRTVFVESIVTQGSSTQGRKDLEELLGKDKFDNPKPVKLIKTLLSISSNPNSIILDFFSGSATTAHAVLQLNAEDSGNRKYIMVQLAEKTDKKSDSYKNGFKNICEIGQERIRKASQKVLEDNKENTNIKNLDIGFRVFKIDTSNMTDVFYTPGDYSQDLLSDLESNIKSDRNDIDLLFGCLIEWGLPLSLSYNSEEIEGCIVHNYNNGDLVACFNENIPDSVIKYIAKQQPLRVVFRDNSFANSPSKINVSEIFKSIAPDTRVKVI